jgi:hypothetical protein
MPYSVLFSHFTQHAGSNVSSSLLGSVACPGSISSYTELVATCPRHKRLPLADKLDRSYEKTHASDFLQLSLNWIDPSTVTSSFCADGRAGMPAKAMG